MIVDETKYPGPDESWSQSFGEIGDAWYHFSYEISRFVKGLHDIKLIDDQFITYKPVPRESTEYIPTQKQVTFDYLRRLQPGPGRRITSGRRLSHNKRTGYTSRKT